MNPHLYRTEAVVLDRRDFGEADRLLTLFTPGMGKVRAIAKGSRRTTSRLSGHIELFTHTQLFLATGRNLDVITQSQLMHSHERLREDLWRAALGFHVVELVNHFSEERLENPGMWRALLDVLRRLDEAPAAPQEFGIQNSEFRMAAETKASYEADPAAAMGPNSEFRIPNSSSAPAELAVRYFEARVLDYTGYRPEVWTCTACRERLQAVVNYFHPPSGGMLCGSCSGRHSGALPVSVDAIKVLRLLQEGDYRTATRLRLTSNLMRQVETALRLHLSYVLERELRATRLLDELRVGV